MLPARAQKPRDLASISAKIVSHSPASNIQSPVLTEPEITPVSEEFINYDLTRNMYPPGYRLPQAPKGYGLYFEERQITVAHSDGMLIRPNLSIEEFEKISKCQNGYSNVPKRSMTKNDSVSEDEHTAQGSKYDLGDHISVYQSLLLGAGETTDNSKTTRRLSCKRNISRRISGISKDGSILIKRSMSRNIYSPLSYLPRRRISGSNSISKTEKLKTNNHCYDKFQAQIIPSTEDCIDSVKRAENEWVDDDGGQSEKQHQLCDLITGPPHMQPVIHQNRENIEKQDTNLINIEPIFLQTNGLNSVSTPSSYHRFRSKYNVSYASEISQLRLRKAEKKAYKQRQALAKKIKDQKAYLEALEMERQRQEREEQQLLELLEHMSVTSSEESDNESNHRSKEKKINKREKQKINNAQFLKHLKSPQSKSTILTSRAALIEPHSVYKPVAIDINYQQIPFNFESKPYTGYEPVLFGSRRGKVSIRKRDRGLIRLRRQDTTRKDNAVPKYCLQIINQLRSKRSESPVK